MINRITIAAILGSVVFASAASGQTLMLAPTDLPGELDLVLLNETNAAIAYQPPAWMAVDVASGGKDSAGRLDRIEGSPAELQLPPGGFARVRYRLVADAVRGDALVRLVKFPTVMASVKAPPEAAPTVASPAPAPSTPDAAGGSPPEHQNMFRDVRYQTEGGLVEYLANRFRPYEPIYFLAGDVDPMAKFQISLKYQIFDPERAVAKAVPPLGNLFVAYSQTSFWDLRGDSKPFFDNSYRPELFFLFTDLDDKFTDAQKRRVMPEWLKLDLQLGIGHESNGRPEPDSRSINRVFAQPTITLGDRSDYFVSVGLRFFQYIGDLGDNPDIAEYRGDWVDMKLVAGQAGGLQLAAIGRLGNDRDKGSIQLDLSFPVRKLTGDNLDIFFHTQYFNGFGESLKEYDQQESSLRFGFSIVR